jgi:hypothetical protein
VRGAPSPCCFSSEQYCGSRLRTPAKLGSVVVYLVADELHVSLQQLLFLWHVWIESAGWRGLQSEFRVTFEYGGARHGSDIGRITKACDSALERGTGNLLRDGSLRTRQHIGRNLLNPERCQSICDFSFEPATVDRISDVEHSLICA